MTYGSVLKKNELCSNQKSQILSEIKEKGLPLLLDFEEHTHLKGVDAELMLKAIDGSKHRVDVLQAFVN